MSRRRWMSHYGADELNELSEQLDVLASAYSAEVEGEGDADTEDDQE